MKPQSEERKKRLAAALRQNLKRRKSAVAERSNTGRRIPTSPGAGAERTSRLPTAE